MNAKSKIATTRTAKTKERGTAAGTSPRERATKSHASPQAPATPSEKPRSGKSATRSEKTPPPASAPAENNQPFPAQPAAAPKSKRVGSKTARILDLLQREGGATQTELMAATNWQAHSVRGFLSGTIGRKMGLTLISTKADNGERTYSLPSKAQS